MKLRIFCMISQNKQTLFPHTTLTYIIYTADVVRFRAFIYIYALKITTSATPHERQRVSIRIVTLHSIVCCQPVKNADINRVSDLRTDERCPHRTQGVGSELHSSAMWRRVVWSNELILRAILLHQTSGKKKLSRGLKQQVPLKHDFILQDYNATHPRMYTPPQGPPPEPQISPAIGSRWRKRTRRRWMQRVLRRNVRAIPSAQYRVHYQGSLSGISGEQFVTVTVSRQVPRFLLVISHSTNTPCSFIYHLRDGQ